MKSIQRNQGGFTLVEILLVLGIIAILAIAAFIIYPQVQASNRANTEQSNLTAITAGTKNLFGSTRDYGPATNAVLNVARVFPAGMNGGKFGSTDTVSSSWSGSVTVTGDTCLGVSSAAANTRCFQVLYAGMPSEVCSKLVPGLLTNYKLIKISGTATALATPADVAVACAKNNPVDVTIVSE